MRSRSAHALLVPVVSANAPDLKSILIGGLGTARRADRTRLADANVALHVCGDAPIGLPEALLLLRYYPLGKDEPREDEARARAHRCMAYVMVASSQSSGSQGLRPPLKWSAKAASRVSAERACAGQGATPRPCSTRTGPVSSRHSTCVS